MALRILASGHAWADTDKAGPMAKVSHDLVVVYDQYETYLEQSGGAAFKPSNPFVRVIDGWVAIDAVASGDVHILQDDLEAMGMHGAVAFGRMVSGYLRISAIEALAALASLHFAGPAYAATNVGLVTSQGEQAMRADMAHTTGVDGAGVTVRMLSDSFNCLGGAAADVASDDLSPVTVIQELPNCSRGTDEGRAMLQLVHDVAPGASLAIPQIRLKPEIVAPDGTNTTFFRRRDVKLDGFPNFFGTSAAAPHVAAVAALMLQAVPTTVPERVYESLETTAIDMGPSGFDFDSGFGLIQADQALAALVSAAPEVIVYVGYLNNVQGTQNPVDIPTPFDPDAQTMLISTGGVDTPHDTGVIRFENRTKVPVIINPGLQVTCEQGLFQLWNSFLPITLAPGQNLVLAETANCNFETSSCGLAIDPVLSGSVNGQAFVFTDTAWVLLGREDASARDLNETTPYQVLGRIDGQGAVITTRASQ